MSSTYSKRADSAAEVTRLHREASMLRRVAQPGIVEIASQQLGAQSGELHFVGIDGITFDQATLSPRRLLRVMTALSATVAHLHDSGVAHNRITGDHVILSKLDGRPTLCGFREATSADAGSLEFANDVASLGRLLDSKLRTSPNALRSRLQEDAPREQRSSASVALQQEFQALVAEATDIDPTKRPTARRFAAKLRLLSVVPSKQTSTSIRGRHYRAELPVHASRRSAIVGSAVVAASIAVIALSWTIGGVTASSSSNTPISYIGPVCSTQANGTLVTDIDGDGCGDAITFTDGAVKVNNETYVVGQTGDVMAIGYWSCKNPRTLALVRPATGKVYVFDSWPSRGNEVTPRLVATIKGADALSAKLGANGCDVIQIGAEGKFVDVNPMGKNKS